MRKRSASERPVDRAVIPAAAEPDHVTAVAPFAGSGGGRGPTDVRIGSVAGRDLGPVAIGMVEGFLEQVFGVAAVARQGVGEAQQAATVGRHKAVERHRVARRLRRDPHDPHTLSDAARVGICCLGLLRPTAGVTRRGRWARRRRVGPQAVVCGGDVVGGLWLGHGYGSLRLINRGAWCRRCGAR